MAKIEIYSKSWCPFCIRAIKLLQMKQVEFDEIDVTSDPIREEEMINRSNRLTVPQIFIDGEAIGGYDDLSQLNETERLDQLLFKSHVPAV